MTQINHNLRMKNVIRDTSQKCFGGCHQANVQHLHKVHTCTVLKEEDDSEYPVFSNTNPPLMANVKLNNAKLQMKVNMGVTLSIIIEEEYSL